MKVETSRFGEIEVPDDSMITFPEGVIGFKDARGFVIFDCGEDGIFKWLQSTEIPELAFVICEASLLLPTYKVMMGRQEQELLQIESPDDAVVCLILVIPDDPSQATANLLGPIVMNSMNRIGMQMVLVNPEYSTKFKIFQQVDNGETADGNEEATHAGA